ncbi:MAG: hypothetical protein WB615_02110 [Candidatus Tumulicola sp.]
MPFLAVVHLQAASCTVCGASIAEPGARSFVVDARGSPISFDAGDPPAEMTVEIACPNGHSLTLLVPNEISAEETLMIPDQAPIAADAVMRSGTTETGKQL